MVAGWLDKGEEIVAWNIADPKHKTTPLLRVDAAGHESITLSPSGKLMTVTGRTVGGTNRTSTDSKTPPETGYCVVYDLANGKKVYEKRDFTDRVWSAAISNDSRLLAVGVGNRVNLINVQTGKIDSRIPTQRATIGMLVFSPDGNVLASRCGNNILSPCAFGFFGFSDAESDLRVHLWNTATCEELSDLGGNMTTINSVAFFADSKSVATAGGTMNVRIWDTATGNVSSEISASNEKNLVTLVATSPKGRVVACVESDEVNFSDLDALTIPGGGF